MKIAIIGTGRVGRVLGRGWAGCGHDIIFGSRHPERDDLRQLVRDIDGASAVPVAAAIEAAPLVVLATPWRAAEATIAELGDWSNKILVDCTNPIAPGLQPVFGAETSGAEEIARQASGAQVVKAFNTTGTENMADPNYNGQALTMFICGDDDGAKAIVAGLTRDLGFEVADVGDLTAARLLEPLALVWIRLANRQGLGRHIGFKLLRRG